MKKYVYITLPLLLIKKITDIVIEKPETRPKQI